MAWGSDGSPCELAQSSGGLPATSDGPKDCEPQRALSGLPGGAPLKRVPKRCEAGEIVEIAEVKQGWVRLAESETHARDVQRGLELLESAPTAPRSEDCEAWVGRSSPCENVWKATKRDVISELRALN